MKKWVVLGFLLMMMVLLISVFSIVTQRAFWLFSIMYFVGCYYTLIALFGAFWDHDRPHDDPHYRPFVSILIPMKNESDVILGTIKDLRSIFYHQGGKSRLEIIIIDDSSTDGCDRLVNNFIKGMGNGSRHRVRLLKNKGPVHGKPAALNFALKHTRGEIICVFDADARVPPDFIEKAIPYFKDKKVGGVQGKVRIYNRLDNTLTEIQDDEFASFNRAVQRSRDAIGGAVALGGNGQLTRRSALMEVGGWMESSLTEDLELSVRFYSAGWRIRYAEGSTVYQEAVTTLRALFRQRTRWSQGHILTFLQMAPTIFRNDKMPLFKKFDLLVYLTGIMTPGFVFLSYFFGFFVAVTPFMISSGVNDLLWIWASVAFIPVIFWGLYGEVSKNPFSLLFRSLRIFMFCFHWIPTFFYGWYLALYGAFTDKHPKWEKTRHSGAEFILKMW